MDHVEELRRVVRGYRQQPPHKAPAGLLDAIGKLHTELGPDRKMHLRVPGGGRLEDDLRSVATKLVKEGGVSHVAGTLLHGILGQLGTPGRPAQIEQQPNSAGQLPEPVPAGFPSPQ